MVRRCDNSIDGTSCCTEPCRRRLEAHLLTVAQDDGRMRQCTRRVVWRHMYIGAAVLTAAPTLRLEHLTIVWSHRAAGPHRPPRPKVSRGVRADYTRLATDFLWDSSSIVLFPNNYLSGWSTTQDEEGGGRCWLRVPCELHPDEACLLVTWSAPTGLIV